jgi:hypothetical protein
MALAFPVSLRAAGAPIRKPLVVVAGPHAPFGPSLPAITAVPPTSSEEQRAIAPEHLFGGCGGRRIRDARTGQCRGPADIGR